MATTRADLSEWFDRGVEEGAAFMIVACDTFDWGDYPVYVKPDEDVRKRVEAYDKGLHPMQKVMEVYSLKKPKEPQLEQHRCFEYD